VHERPLSLWRPLESIWYFCGFTIGFESRGANGCKEQWYVMDTRIYTSSGVHEDKNPMSCVYRCTIIHWDETPCTPPFIG
jgi:hypothetical protein